MAIINCAECGKEVSDKAEKCTHCGVQINSVEKTKFCKFCGEKINIDAVTCVKCGRQVEELRSASSAQPSIVIQNTNTNANTNTNTNTMNMNAAMFKKEKNKWVAILLCLFLGVLGAHKFYEGKISMGIVYIFTFGVFGIGVIVDLIGLLFKKNPYYV